MFESVRLSPRRQAVVPAPRRGASMVGCCQGCASYTWGPAPGWLDWRTTEGVDGRGSTSRARILVRCAVCNSDGRKPVPHPPKEWPG